MHQADMMAIADTSLPVRGAWIEMLSNIFCVVVTPSLPVRGAWIEISSWLVMWNMSTSLPVRGAWIEILRGGNTDIAVCSRSPCGERGLKFPHGFRSPKT